MTVVDEMGRMTAVKAMKAVERIIAVAVGSLKNFQGVKVSCTDVSVYGLYLDACKCNDDRNM